jgi:hypothetical protein
VQNVIILFHQHRLSRTVGSHTKQYWSDKIMSVWSIGAAFVQNLNDCSTTALPPLLSPSSIFPPPPTSRAFISTTKNKDCLSEMSIFYIFKHFLNLKLRNSVRVCTLNVTHNPDVSPDCRVCNWLSPSNTLHTLCLPTQQAYHAVYCLSSSDWKKTKTFERPLCYFTSHESNITLIKVARFP